MTHDPVNLRGIVYLGGASRRMDGRLESAEFEGEIWVRVLSNTEGELAASPVCDVQIDTAIGRAPRKLTFGDGSVFETTDFDGFARIDSDLRGKQLHRLERFGPHLITFTIACLVAAFLLWRYGLDILAGVAVAMTPQVVVEQIDKGTLQTLDFVIAEPSALSEAEKDAARAIYARVIAALPARERDAREFQLLFRDVPAMGPNAFALPGGTMVMTDDLIRSFASKDIIAGILGHEVGHIVEEHGLRRLYRSLGAYILIALLAGDTGPLLEDILLEGNALLSLSFGRAQETAADEFGLALSHDAGFDPAGLKAFFVELSAMMGGAEAEGPGWLSSHPSNKERIEAIETFIERLPD